MEELSKDDLELLRKKIPAFKKSFSEGIQQHYEDDKFKLGVFNLGEQKDGFLHYDFEYRGQCSLYKGDGKHAGKLKISELKSLDDVFEKIERLISEKVHYSFMMVR